MRILVTGAAGFIGSHLVATLLERGDNVVGLDNINSYYDIKVKYGRLIKAGIINDFSEGEGIEYGKKVDSVLNERYTFIKIDLEDKLNLAKLFEEQKFDAVCNLAAQAGVRYSLTNPDAYISSNIQGFLNILECCRQHNVNNLSYASSSSVYGLNEKLPFSTEHNVDHPISLYAASKKSNELMAHTYSHLFGISTTGLRFFTVYGPWGRPDMALFIFVKAAIEGKPIEVYNNGEMSRDFTYIDDIIQGVVKVIDNPAAGQKNWDENCISSSSAPYKIYNIGNNSPVKLIDFINEIEKRIGKNIDKKFLPLQAGDVPATYADVSDFEHSLDYKSTTSIQEGVNNFIDWYLDFYNNTGKINEQ